jgi:hypothetical protein
MWDVMNSTEDMSTKRQHDKYETSLRVGLLSCLAKLWIIIKRGVQGAMQSY